MSVKSEKVMKLTIYLILSLILIGCAKPTAKVAEKPLARVLDHYLYKSDLGGFYSCRNNRCRQYCHGPGILLRNGSEISCC